MRISLEEDAVSETETQLIQESTYYLTEVTSSPEEENLNMKAGSSADTQRPSAP
jgi:hypothetical protein